MSLIIVPAAKINGSNDHHNVTNNYNITIGDYSHINAINAENSTDNSSNEIHALPADFFEQTRALLENVNESHRIELSDILAKIEATHASGNKKDCANWFGQFFSLASIADCITVAQPLLQLIPWLLGN